MILLKEAFPIYLFFAYLQIERYKKHGDNESKKFIDRNIVNMKDYHSKKSSDPEFFEKSLKFINFMLEHKDTVNYPLNLYLLNRYLFVPDAMFLSGFSEYQIEERISEYAQNDWPIGHKEAFDYDSNWKYSAKFTLITPCFVNGDFLSLVLIFTPGYFKRKKTILKC